MSIVSLSFLMFLSGLIAVYYILPKACSPYVILAGSLYFYLQFDYKYSLFLFASIIITYFGARLIAKAKTVSIKKLILGSVILLNIGTLFFVKFVPYISGLAGKVLDVSVREISVIVPIGISFYTLQLCGYCIDVYREKYSPEKNILKYASFATFFPLMLQGPISRYDQLAPTLFAGKEGKNFYDNLTSGSQLMLWGFFKKLVIADRAAVIVNLIFDNYPSYSGMTVIIAILCYTLQIYTDFSGCVDICRGAAKTFGIEVIDNFRQPYLSTSIQDFWKRWHIALSSWFRDYLYIPLGGNRKGKIRKFANLTAVFFASGLWHGVGIHYIVWGMVHAFFQIVGALTLEFKKKLCALLKIDRESEIFKWVQRIINFMLINFTWLLFRANGTVAAFKMLLSMFDFGSGKEWMSVINMADLIIISAGAILLFIIGIYRDSGMSIRKQVSEFILPLRWALYLLLFITVIIFGVYGPGYSGASFIYMNF